VFVPPADAICFPDAAQTLLLRAALLEGEPARAAFRAWRAAIDPEALDEGSYRLLPLLSRSLLRLGEADSHLDRWKGTYRRTFVLNERLFHDMARVLRALAAAGIPAIALKGAALVTCAYKDSGVRPMADLDVLVEPRRARQAFAALRALGWRSEVRRPESLLGVRHAAVFVSPEGRELDLHWSLLWESCAGDADAALRAAARTASLRGAPALAPAACDLLLHVCVHGLSSAGGPAIRWAADAFTLAALSARAAKGAPDAIDWARLAREAASRRLALPVGAALRWIRDHLDAPVPEDALARIEGLPVSAAERAELAAKVRPLRGANVLRYYWFQHRRAAGGGLLRDLACFPAFLRVHWGLDHAALLPYYLLVRILRRAWEGAGLGDAPGPRPTAGARPSTKPRASTRTLTSTKTGPTPRITA